MFREFIYMAQAKLGKLGNRRRMTLPAMNGSPPRGRALVSYLTLPLFGDPANFPGHSNVWESSEIVHLLRQLGYSVDLIHWQDCSFVPSEEYDLVFDIHRNLLRYSGKSSRKVFHVTGSHPEFSNQAELQRLENLRSRRGVLLQQRRGIGAEDLHIFSDNLQAADTITLIGNEVTASTFPVGIQSKIRCVSATGSLIPGNQPTVYHGTREEYLWFNGAGAIHKGLDLVLEVFARNPLLTLHVVGPYAREHDFTTAYRRELTKCPNIHAHGFLYPGTRHFRHIASRVRAFINPTCSEGISTSSITCMQYGMIPLVSRQAGISIPPGMGTMLDECSLDELEQRLRELAALHPDEVRSLGETVRTHAIKAYSRPAFSDCMKQALMSTYPTARSNA